MVVYYVDDILIGDFKARASDASGAAKVVQQTTEVFKWISNLLQECEEKGASDLHIYHTPTGTQLDIRANGDKIPLQTLSADRGDKLIKGFYSAGTQKSTTLPRNAPSAARITSGMVAIPRNIEAIRAQFTPSGHSDFYVVLRFLGSGAAGTKTMADLGYLAPHLELLEEIRALPTGISFFTGPTGAGKSKTLKHHLSTLYKERHGAINIITVEDPIEYTIPEANQIPVPTAQSEEEAKANYIKTLRTMLRMDPDVLSPSEVRDAMTANLAFQAAQTGHVVTSTLHVNSALEAPMRLLELEVNDKLVFNPKICVGLTAQRLIKKLCPECKQPIKAVEKTLSERHKLQIEPLRKAGHDLYVARDRRDKTSCNTCDTTGTIGRTVAAEVVRPDHRLMEILKSEAVDAVLQAEKYWKSSGGISMVEHGIINACLGLVDPFEVIEKVGPMQTTSQRIKELGTHIS